MSSLHVIYHLARADFYERVRRYSFLIMLGLSVFLSYQVAYGNLTLTLSQYRGVYNSAWVGAMISVIATFFVGWFGFYLVKGAVARDRETGVGQIMATTPLSRPLYMLGKWLSNLVVLLTLAGILAVFGLGFQLWQGENSQIDLLTYCAPFLFIVAPLLALTAAFAVLFETISWLRGGFGNIVYFFLFTTSFAIMMEHLGDAGAAFEPSGISLMAREMGQAARVTYPDYIGGFSLGPPEFIQGTFVWSGVDWTPGILLARGALVGAAILLVLLAALFFDRFDPSRAKPRRAKAEAAKAPVEPAAQSLPAVHLKPLSATALRYNFFSVLRAEVRLLLKGQRWWWYAIAGTLIFACLVNSAAGVREIALPLAWAWPVLIWSPLGNRERRHNVQQMTFAAAAPLRRQLPAQWLAGFLVALLLGGGALVRFAIEGDTVGLLALFSGAVFIPSLALAAGVWSGSAKLFEVLYVLLLYIGPLNHTPEVDFIGASGDGRPEFFLPLSLALIAAAVVGRARQVRR